MSQRNRSNPRRHQRAYDAARILDEQGGGEFDRARRKAAERAGVANKRFWPSNEEIQDALLAQRRLFQCERQTAELHRLRKQALAAMHNFSRFMPRLVGPVLTGAAGRSGGVRLHLFAENPEDVVFALLEQAIPWHERERTLRFGGGVRRVLPVFTFVAGETAFELVILPLAGIRNPPLDSVSERPEKGADAAEVARLLEAATSDDAPLTGTL